MSFPKFHVPFLIMSLSVGAAAADPAAPDPVPQPPSLPKACFDPSGKKLADVNCAELEDLLAQQVRIAELQQKIAESKARTDAANTPPAPPPPPPVPAQKVHEAARVIEVFGQQASLRWQGETIAVRIGQRLPGSSWTLSQITTDGVVLVDGPRRASVPVINR